MWAPHERRSHSPRRVTARPNSKGVSSYLRLPRPEPTASRRAAPAPRCRPQWPRALAGRTWRLGCRRQLQAHLKADFSGGGKAGWPGGRVPPTVGHQRAPRHRPLQAAHCGSGTSSSYRAQPSPAPHTHARTSIIASTTTTGYHWSGLGWAGPLGPNLRQLSCAVPVRRARPRLSLSSPALAPDFLLATTRLRAGSTPSGAEAYTLHVVVHAGR